MPRRRQGGAKAKGESISRLDRLDKFGMAWSALTGGWRKVIAKAVPAALDRLAARIVALGSLGSLGSIDDRVRKVSACANMAFIAAGAIDVLVEGRLLPDSHAAPARSTAAALKSLALSLARGSADEDELDVGVGVLKDCIAGWTSAMDR